RVIRGRTAEPTLETSAPTLRTAVSIRLRTQESTLELIRAFSIPESIPVSTRALTPASTRGLRRFATVLLGASSRALPPRHCGKLGELPAPISGLSVMVEQFFITMARL